MRENWYGLTDHEPCLLIAVVYSYSYSVTDCRHYSLKSSGTSVEEKKEVITKERTALGRTQIQPHELIADRLAIEPNLILSDGQLQTDRTRKDVHADWAVPKTGTGLVLD